MTIPCERTQAVLRAREQLKALAFREQIDTGLQQRRAASLLTHFPGAAGIAVGCCPACSMGTSNAGVYCCTAGFRAMRLHS